MKLRTGTPEEAGMSAERVQRLKDLARSWVDGGITPALVVVVARHGVVVLHAAFGHLTPEPNSPPLEQDTLFPLTSLTKPITATAAMILVDDGLLGLNRRVSDYIPEFRGEGKDAVMVHHLLTNTSGLQEEDLPLLEWLAHDSIGLPPADATQHPAIHRILLNGYDVPLSKPPGQEMSYCNFNYELLGEIVRRLSGESLAEFAEERIFQPLGMEDTHYVVPDWIRHRVVQRPPEASFPPFGEKVLLDLPIAAGGVHSTARDMAAFCQMFLNRGRYGDARILSRATVTEMTRNQIPGIDTRYGGEYHAESSWGYGWAIHGYEKWADYDGSLHSSQAFLHGGAGGVYLWADPVYELVGVYFSVLLERKGPRSNVWCVDLFMDAVMGAIDD